jgi:hypothetical protein
MSRLQDRAQERVYAALLRLELNVGHLQFEIESNTLKSKDFPEGLGSRRMCNRFKLSAMPAHPPKLIISIFL